MNNSENSLIYCETTEEKALPSWTSPSSCRVCLSSWMYMLGAWRGKGRRRKNDEEEEKGQDLQFHKKDI